MNLDGLDDTDTSEDGFDTDTEDLEEGVGGGVRV